MSDRYVPAIGARVQMVESEHTTNWTRIDLGRTGVVVGYNVYSFRAEHGPRVSVKIRFDERKKWDGAWDEPIHAAPCQLRVITPN